MPQPSARPGTRLLLDEMFSPVIAQTLSSKGVDAIAVVSDPALNALADARLLEIATATGRCLVTENARDFERLRKAWSDKGKVPAGILFVNAARFPRTPGAAHRIADAVERFVQAERIPEASGVDWLA